MGQGSAHGLFHDSVLNDVDDDGDDGSLVKDMSPVNTKKPTKRATKTKKDTATLVHFVTFTTRCVSKESQDF